ncbi:MAG: FHA domain-containing protein, partial [Planctomycetota bacterium]
FSLELVFAVCIAASGGFLGALVYSDPVGLPRALSWMVLGLGIGGAQGVSEKSAVKLRNGLIGGAAGGFLAGLLFDPIANSGSDMSSRAVAFVILGVSIGALIGLTHVVLKEAWLTVVDGFGPGRQWILSETTTVLGRGDHLPLPFLGYAGRDLDSEHLRITRQPDGQYVVEDANSRIGTSVNGRPIRSPLALGDGDLIKLGSNIVRFEQRRRASVRGETVTHKASSGRAGPIAAPPPPPTTAAPPAFPNTSASQPDLPSPQPHPSPAAKSPPTDSAPRIPPPPPPPG